MGDFIVFDGGLKRVRSTSALRKPVQSTRDFGKHVNQWDVEKIVGSFYGGMTATSISRIRNLPLNVVEDVVRNNSRPVQAQPLAIDRKLRRAA